MATLFHTAIRVFLSSTFRDMQHERDHLVNDVFPVIQRHCAALGISFEVIDLRWGVTGDTAPAEVIAHCMRQIDGCVPYLLGLLGHRYGWIPSDNPDSAPALYPHETGLSVTEIEFMRFEQGVAAADAVGHALIGLRSADLTRQFDADGQFGVEPQASRDAMDRLRQRYAGFGYNTLEQLGSRVHDYFVEQANQLASAIATPLAWIDAQQAQYLRLLSVPGLDAIAPALQRRAPGRTWQNCAELTLQPDCLNILYGGPGSGKTIACASLAQRLREAGSHVLCLHVGASGATSVNHLARDLCHLAGLSFSEKHWRVQLAAAVASLPGLVVILDGLERLDDWAGAPQHAAIIDTSVATQLLDLVECLLAAAEAPRILLALDPDAGPANWISTVLQYDAVELTPEVMTPVHLMQLAPLDGGMRVAFAREFFRYRGKDLTLEQLGCIAEAPLADFDSLHLACHRLQQFGGLCQDQFGQDAFMLAQTSRLFGQTWQQALGTLIGEAQTGQGGGASGARSAILALLVAFYGLPATVLVALVQRAGARFTLRDWAVLEGRLGPLLVRNDTRFQFKNRQVAAVVAALYPEAAQEMTVLRALLVEQLQQENRDAGLAGLLLPDADRIFPAELPRQLAQLPGHPGWRDLLEPVQLAAWFAGDRQAAIEIFKECYDAAAFQRAYDEHGGGATDPVAALDDFRQQARALLALASEEDQERYLAAFDSAELIQHKVEDSATGKAKVAMLTSAYAFRCAIADHDGNKDHYYSAYVYGRNLVRAVASVDGVAAARDSAWMEQTLGWHGLALRAIEALPLPPFMRENQRASLDALHHGLLRALQQ